MLIDCLNKLNISLVVVLVQGREKKNSLRGQGHQGEKQVEDRKGNAGKKVGDLVSLRASLSIMRSNPELMDLP